MYKLVELLSKLNVTNYWQV